MEAPQEAIDIAWWIVSGALLGSVSIIIALLKYGGSRIIQRLDLLCSAIESIVRLNNQQNKAIVELQTRCSMYHNNPVQEKISD